LLSYKELVATSNKKKNRRDALGHSFFFTSIERPKEFVPFVLHLLGACGSVPLANFFIFSFGCPSPFMFICQPASWLGVWCKLSWRAPLGTMRTQGDQSHLYKFTSSLGWIERPPRSSIWWFHCGWVHEFWARTHPSCQRCYTPLARSHF